MQDDMNLSEEKHREQFRKLGSRQKKDMLIGSIRRKAQMEVCCKCGGSCLAVPRSVYLINITDFLI
jgi:hypothetical protein